MPQCCDQDCRMYHQWKGNFDYWWYPCCPFKEWAELTPPSQKPGHICARAQLIPWEPTRNIQWPVLSVFVCVCACVATTVAYQTSPWAYYETSLESPPPLKHISKQAKGCRAQLFDCGLWQALYSGWDFGGLLLNWIWLSFNSLIFYASACHLPDKTLCLCLGRNNLQLDKWHIWNSLILGLELSFLFFHNQQMISSLPNVVLICQIFGLSKRCIVKKKEKKELGWWHEIETELAPLPVRCEDREEQGPQVDTVQQCARCKEAEKWAGSELNLISLFLAFLTINPFFWAQQTHAHLASFG